MSSPSFSAPAIRRAVRSLPLYAASAATPGEGSTASAVMLARTRLKAEQARRIFTEDFRLLALVEVEAGTDRGDGMRVLGVEVRIVARHKNVVFAELGDRPRQIAFVGLAGDVAIAPYVFRRSPLQVSRDLRKVLGPLPVVVHAVHPVQDPFGAAFEEHHLQTRKLLEHAAEHQGDERGAAVS